MHIASLEGNLDAVTELIKYNAELDLVDTWGDTPLSLARSNMHWPVVFALIEQGSEIDKQKIDIKSIFFAAIEENNVKVVKLLLGLSADVLSRNVEGTTAIQLAEDIGNKEMIQVLRSSRSFYYRVDEEDSEFISGSSDLTPLMALNSNNDVVPFRPRPTPGICEPMASE